MRLASGDGGCGEEHGLGGWTVWIGGDGQCGAGGMDSVDQGSTDWGNDDDGSGNGA